MHLHNMYMRINMRQNKTVAVLVHLIISTTSGVFYLWHPDQDPDQMYDQHIDLLLHIFFIHINNWD